jgi:hypothetical protein
VISNQLSQDFDLKVKLNQRDFKLNVTWEPERYNSENCAFLYSSHFRMGPLDDPLSDPKHVVSIEISPPAYGPARLRLTGDWKAYF